jgi:hypothetical protein
VIREKALEMKNSCLQCQSSLGVSIQTFFLINDVPRAALSSAKYTQKYGLLTRPQAMACLVCMQTCFDPKFPAAKN